MLFAGYQATEGGAILHNTQTQDRQDPYVCKTGNTFASDRHSHTDASRAVWVLLWKIGNVRKFWFFARLGKGVEGPSEFSFVCLTYSEIKLTCAHF